MNWSLIEKDISTNPPLNASFFSSFSSSACHQHTQCLPWSIPFLNAHPSSVLLLLSLYFISNPALILILPKEAHFVQQRGYLEPVLTLDSTLDKYPQLKNHKTNGRPELAVFWQGVCWSGLAAANYSAQVTSYCKKKKKNWPLRRLGG